MSRIVGAVVPLFSIRSRSDWGIGQFSDLALCARWLQSAGCSMLQLLPTYTLAGGERSPYGACTAFGLDPVYVTIDAIADLDANEIAKLVSGDQLARVRNSSVVLYDDVRNLKAHAIGRAFELFYEREWLRSTPRAGELRAFIARESAWLDDYALYMALREIHERAGWQSWPAKDRDRDAQEMRRVEELHSKRLLAVKYAQWIAFDQWAKARIEVNRIGVELMGDLPFIVGAESADVWSHPREFERETSLGVPPDGFDPNGQDWGLPSYNWRAMDANGLEWLRDRTAHAARLYDRFRLDHVVGYFRMWLCRQGECGRFEPGDESAQNDRGRNVLGAMKEAAGKSELIAEDLGVIPQFVRDAMNEFGMPGYRVLPWERDAHGLRDPRQFPALSVATWSTHDTPPITAWWGDLQPYEREEFARIGGFSPDIAGEARDNALLSLLFQSGSSLALVQAQELLGEKTRINTPGTVSDNNWAYRLPEPIESLMADKARSGRFEQIAALARAAYRSQ